MARGDAGDSCAGSIGVRFDSNVVDEAEVDDVAGNFGVVTVAQSREDVGFSESRGWKCSLQWRDLGGWEGWYPPPPPCGKVGQVYEVKALRQASPVPDCPGILIYSLL